MLKRAYKILVKLDHAIPKVQATLELITLDFAFSKKLKKIKIKKLKNHNLVLRSLCLILDLITF